MTIVTTWINGKQLKLQSPGWAEPVVFMERGFVKLIRKMRDGLLFGKVGTQQNYRVSVFIEH
jgi:hypothetical protein